MGSKFIEQKYYAEKINAFERENNNPFQTLILRIRRETIR